MSWELITVAFVALRYNVNRITNPHTLWQNHKFHYSRATWCSKRDYRLVSDPNLWCVCVCMYIMKRIWEELCSVYTHTHTHAHMHIYIFGMYFNISLKGNAGWILYIHKHTHTHTHTCMYVFTIYFNISLKGNAVWTLYIQTMFLLNQNSFQQFSYQNLNTEYRSFISYSTCVNHCHTPTLNTLRICILLSFIMLTFLSTS
jgi:hypothetical protein